MRVQYRNHVLLSTEISQYCKHERGAHLIQLAPMQVPCAIQACHCARAAMQADHRESQALLTALHLSEKFRSWPAWVFAAGAVATRTMHFPGSEAGCLTPFGDLHNYQPPCGPVVPETPSQTQGHLSEMHVEGKWSHSLLWRVHPARTETLTVERVCQQGECYIAPHFKCWACTPTLQKGAAARPDFDPALQGAGHQPQIQSWVWQELESLIPCKRGTCSELGGSTGLASRCSCAMAATPTLSCSGTTAFCYQRIHMMRSLCPQSCGRPQEGLLAALTLVASSSILVCDPAHRMIATCTPEHRPDTNLPNTTFTSAEHGLDWSECTCEACILSRPRAECCSTRSRQ
jgi:hypothetical protein